MTDNQFEHDQVTADDVVDAADDKSLDRPERLSPKEVGDMAVKFATDTAYAAAGFANLVAEKAREFADKQRATVEGAGDGADPTKAFLDQLTSQLNKFVDDLGHTYKDLAERGRDAVAKMQAQAAERPAPKDAPGMFDIVDDAETAEPRHSVAEEDVEVVDDLGEVSENNPDA